MLKIDDVLKNLKVPLTSEREALIRSAYEFARVAHREQKRKSGEDYIQHPLGTALNLARIGMGSKTIAAGLLHDIPEDTNVTLKELEEKFGHEISFIVSGITKLGKKKLALETMEVFVPIANRLGIGELKSKLEDLAFKYLELENYEYTKKVRE